MQIRFSITEFARSTSGKQIYLSRAQECHLEIVLPRSKYLYQGCCLAPQLHTGSIEGSRPKVVIMLESLLNKLFGIVVHDGRQLFLQVVCDATCES